MQMRFTAIAEGNRQKNQPEAAPSHPINKKEEAIENRSRA
jgi:hypothetical protein